MPNATLICRTQVDDAPIFSSRYFKVQASGAFAKSSGVNVSRYKSAQF